jgi:hypothetical protein
MAFAGKVLGEGQLPTTKGTLYTVPVGKTTYVKRISFFNDNAAAQTIIVYIKPGAASRKWRRYVLEQNEAVDLLDHGDALILEAGDLIEAQTTTVSAVDYVLMGVEETP